MNQDAVILWVEHQNISTISGITGNKAFWKSHRYLGVNTWPKLSSSISPRENLKLGLRSFSASLLNVRVEKIRAFRGWGGFHIWPRASPGRESVSAEE